MEIMRKSKLIERIADGIGEKPRLVERVLDELAYVMEATVREGGKLRLSGCFTLDTVPTAPRKIYDRFNDRWLDVPAGKRARIKLGATLKKAGKNR